MALKYKHHQIAFQKNGVINILDNTQVINLSNILITIDIGYLYPTIVHFNLFHVTKIMIITNN